MSTIEILQILAIISFALAGLLFVLAVILFLVFRIPSVIGSLTGRTKKKEIANIKEQSVDTSGLYKSAHHGKQSKFMSQSGNLKSQPQAPIPDPPAKKETPEFHAGGAASLYDDMPGRTGNFSNYAASGQNPYDAYQKGSSDGNAETSVIGGDSTNVLGGEETNVLGGSETSVLGGNETSVLGGNETSVLGTGTAGGETSVLSAGETSVLSAGETSVLGVGAGGQAQVLGNVSETSVLTADMYPGGNAGIPLNIPKFQVEFRIEYTDSKEIVA